MRSSKLSDHKAFLASVAVHFVFCTQALIAVLKEGGIYLNDAFFWVFLPHTFFMYFLPPAWPITSGEIGQPNQVDWLRLAGKLTVAFPASIIYGLILGAIWSLLAGSRPGRSGESL